MEQFQNILNFRFACKRYGDKEISTQDLKTILEAGILAPSSCGIEQFHFLLLSSEEALKKLPEICMKQGTARTANKAIVVLASKKEIAGPGSDKYEWHMKQRTNVLNNVLPSEKQVTLDFVRERSNVFCDKEEEDFLSWSKANSYLAAMNIMNQAASLGIDSCPVEGFSQELFDKYFPQFKTGYEVSLVITLGYRSEEPTPRIRLPFEDMVTTM